MKIHLGESYLLKIRTGLYQKVTVVKDDEGDYEGLTYKALEWDYSDRVEKEGVFVCNNVTNLCDWCDKADLNPLTDKKLLEINGDNYKFDNDDNTEVEIVDLTLSPDEDPEPEIVQNNAPSSLLGENSAEIAQSNSSLLSLREKGTENNDLCLVRGDNNAKAKITRQAKIAAQSHIKNTLETKKKSPIKVATCSEFMELEKKYDKITFEQSNYGTYMDFGRVMRRYYLDSLPCIKKHRLCLNRNKIRNQVWCPNIECKDVDEYTLNIRMDKIWRIYEAGQRIEKPSIYTGWITKKENISSNEKCSNREISFKKNNIPWCYVCGQKDLLKKCENCTAAYHEICPEKKNINKGCPQCKYGNSVPSDGIVWHKLANYPWWPAKLISLNMRPSCLGNPPSPYHCSVFYYGTDNYAFADVRELCTFSVAHNPELHGCRDKNLRHAFQEACEEYVCMIGRA